jgi:CubicO group peptidase (beta-lactamase class C family)/predicted dienelactone hydrolase
MLYRLVLSLSKVKWFTVLSLFVIAALLLSACQPIVAPSAATEPPPPHGLRFDAPPYAVDGTYPVGVRYYTIPAVGENDRELTATVWYPTEPPEGETPPMVYEPQFAPGDVPPFSVLGKAQLDAPLDASGAPYPLVVYSHAHWSIGQEVPYFVEHLASRGFVVISVDHEDNWSTWGATGFGPMDYPTPVRRAQEVTRQIDFAEDLSAPGSDMEGMIATDKVGVGGWSMGGTTSLAVAGAQLDTATLRAWCEEDPLHAQAAFWACIDVLNHEEELAAFAGLDEVPAGLWPSTKDERVAAAVRLSGSTVWFGSDGLAAVDVPVLLFHGGGEATTDPSLQVGDPFGSVASPRKAEVAFDHAGHTLFNSSCQDNPDMAAMGLPMFCTDPVWDMDRAHDLINHFATAFLLAELKGDADAAATLAPENVAFPGIQYESTGYGAAAAPESLLDDATVAKIESTVEEMMAESGTPGYAVGIVKDGEIVYTKGFGVESVSGDEPVTVHSVFGTGSTGKTATAIAVMQLVEAGKIDLDAPVTDYLPYFELADERYKEITVRQLLTHRSGVPADPADWFPLPIEYDDGAVERYVRSMGDLELLFAPDAEWSYSNLGMIVLADIVAKVSGQTFEEYLQANVLDPLGMADTMLIIPEGDQAKLTGNHVRSKDGQVVVSDIFPYRRQFTPAEPLYSSITDMARFAAVNLNRGEFEGTRILPAETYDAMWEPLSKTNWDFGPILTPTVTDFGMTWMLGELDGHRIVSFGGVDEGYTGELLLAPDDGIAVVANGNYFDFEEFNLASPAAAVEILALLLTEN